MESSTSDNGEVKKENDNDETLVDDRASPSRKRRSNSVIDSIGGSGIVVIGEGGAGESTFPAGGVTSRPKSLSAPDTSVFGCERIGPPNPAQATAYSFEPIKKVADKTDAHVRIFDDLPKNSEFATKTAFMSVTQDADRYNMNHKNRGICVIFNHEEFEIGGFDRREGSSVDAMKLEKSFGNLGFDVMVHDNLTHREVIDVLDELSNKTDHRDNDCICIVVLTHGLQNDMISAKDAIYKTDKLWKPFTADNCPTLAGKPKLFFIQACRGEEVDNGVVLSPRSLSTTDSVSSYKIPTHADILIAHSSAQGFYTWRNPTDGTWYVSCLCEILNKYGTELDLLSMLTMTARKVAIDYASYNPEDSTRHEKKQVPSLTSLLLRTVYFPPKTNM
ncbi:caspase-1-like [Odontomachus brunneus]|uniref:caspase-1-like n=1 Tax=Odontomachus brunneus TaxID=486640 RepID=UPI0013F1B2A5|nr:caspase-1-like [Odontomachus brunneus]